MTTGNLGKHKKYLLIRLLKIAGWVIAALLSLFILVAVMLQNPVVQNFVKDKIVQVVNKKADTQLQIGRIGIALPGDVLVENVFVPDNKRDTLLYAGQLRVRANLLALLNHRLSVRLISLQKSTVNFIKRRDGKFNFTYIIDALNKNNAAKTDTLNSNKTGNSGNSLQFKIHDLSLKSINFSYRDLADSLDMHYRIGTLKLTVDQFDPGKSIYKLNKLVLAESKGYYYNYKTLPSPQKNDTSKLPEVGAKSFSIVSSSFVYADNHSEMGFNLKVDKFYLQPRNIDLNNSVLDVKNLLLTGSSFVLKDTSKLNSSPGNGSSGPFAWKIKLDRANLQDNAFVMSSVDQQSGKTTSTSIERAGGMLSNLVINKNQMQGDIKGVTATINHKYDLKRLDVSLNAGETNAKISDLLVMAGSSVLKASLDADYPKGAVLDIISPARMKQATFSLQIPGCSISKDDILRWFTLDSLSAGIDLPPNIKLTGYASGSADSLSGEAAVVSEDGTINTRFTAGKLTGSTPSYKIQTDIPELKAGKILKQPSLTGDLSLFLSVNGKGRSLDKLSGSVSAKIRNVEYNKYAYKNISLSGSLKDSLMKAKLVSPDSNAMVDVTVSTRLGKKIPGTSLVAEVHALNLQKLNLSNQLFAFSGLLNADVTGKNLDSLSAAVNVSKLKIYHADTLLVPDSINLALTSQGNQSAIQFHSGFMDLKYNGKGNLSKLPAEMKSYFSRYLLSGQSAYDSVNENTSFYFDAEIKKIALIREFFFPKLENLDVKLLRGRYDGSSGKFNFAMHTGNVVYDHYDFDSLTFGITTDSADIRYNLRINSIQSSDIDIPLFKAAGKLYGANLFSSMQIIDRSGDPRFKLNWELSLGDTVHELSLSPDSLIINYDQWKVNKNNGITFSKAGMFFRDMVLSYKSSRISLQSEIPSSNDTTLHISLKNIDLGYISQIISSDSSFLMGTLNGDAEIQHLITGPVFSGNIQAQKLGYRGEELGNLKLKADNKNSSGKYIVDASLINGSSRVLLNGSYGGTSANAVDLNLEIDSFKLHTVQPYLRKYLTTLDGNLSGNLKIAGTIQNPKPSGAIRIENTDFILATYNTHLKIAEDKINVDDKGIHLNTFSLEDNRNNKATISGSILTTNFKDFRFNVNASASNLLILNNPKATDQQYYGKLSISTDIRIRGNDKKPVINASVTVQNGTNLTYSMASQGGYVSDEGIVKFVSFAADSSRFSSVEKTISVTDSLQNKLRGMEVSANIEIQKGSKFTIILNPSVNDRLDITTGAVLSFSMASSGIMNLTGKATIESGTYHMSLTRVQKQFDIQQGSSITWTGNPTEPQVNITAIYSIRTAPIGLFSASELPSDQQAKQPYRKQLPFRVELNMTGSLTDPNLKFSINMPRQYEGVLNGAVAAKLDQLRLDQSEVNKQAVSLLLFGNFLSQTDQLAMLSLSNVDYANKILSEALNKTAERYIKFINLNFQLQSYNDYGQSTFTRTRTDLSVKASKELFNDRLSVNLGSVFVLESEQKKQSVNALNNIAPEANVVYKLNSDGSLRIRAFNQNEYTGLLDGLVRETGVSIVYVKNFNEFIELFNKGKVKP